MARLIDDLRGRFAKVEMPGFVEHDRERWWADLAARTSDLIANPELPVLLIDNVADYYYSCDQEFWDLREHFPNLAPPFPACWFEHRIVKHIHSKECGDTDVSQYLQNGRVGVLMHALDPEQVCGEGMPDNLRWILWCELFIDYGKRHCTAQGPHGSMFLCIDKEGVIIEKPWMQSLAREEWTHLMRTLMTWLHPALLTISFLHCKNVQLIDNRVDAPLAKKYRERHGISPCSYKTLIIEPLKKILRAEGRSGEVGVQKAMHICRGHFRDYREGRGLFGKYKQLVWMPSIVRGSKGEMPPREIEVKV